MIMLLKKKFFNYEMHGFTEAGRHMPKKVIRAYIMDIVRESKIDIKQYKKKPLCNLTAADIKVHNQ